MPFKYKLKVFLQVNKWILMWMALVQVLMHVFIFIFFLHTFDILCILYICSTSIVMNVPCIIMLKSSYEYKTGLIDFQLKDNDTLVKNEFLKI